MSGFIIRFLICNFFISVIIVILLLMKQIFKNLLTSRMQYNLWFVLLGLLAIPFSPVSSLGFCKIFPWFEKLKNGAVSDMAMTVNNSATIPTYGNSDWKEDFTLSVSMQTSSYISLILYAIWLAGIFVMAILVIKSTIRLNRLKKSALPLQNKEVSNLYKKCLDELHITRDIPIYSTAFLNSPIIVGLFQPEIYLPIQLISDYNATDMRYILLHELQHYKHKDALANYIISFAKILYWFNPLVWYAFAKMRSDREVACDTSVLNILKECEYEAYGNTLINFAEKVSLTPFPFVSGIVGNMEQMKQRIINIASYQKPSVSRRLKGISAFMMIAVFLLGSVPTLSTYAENVNIYHWKISDKNIRYIDFSGYFGKYDGCFVLYDMENDMWSIYNINHATQRTSPYSTYKIYDALFGLEEGIITPDDSYMPWNGEVYPFDAWNKEQTLSSAMSSSVNWYFQSLDRQMGTSVIYKYVHKIGYGNKNISGDLKSYWLEAPLKISPLEQVELLTKLYNNEFAFKTENINAVKEAMFISSSDAGSIYGKTGTGQINERNVNGWFIGYTETLGHTYFFATNIQGKDEASGSKAAEITMSILSDVDIWKSDTIQ